jgi:RNA polymerase sigma-70 factor, ECF subfamily
MKSENPLMADLPANAPGVTAVTLGGLAGISTGMGPLPDLVDRLRAGDVGAFREAYARHAGPIFRYLARMANERAVAEDLFQETWLAFARNASRLEEGAELAPLLFTIARNKFLNWRRWSLLDLGRLVDLRHDPEPTAADASETSEALAAIDAALKKLPLASREILLLVGVEGLEPTQAAIVLGLRPDAARQRLARARAQLAESLGADRVGARLIPTKVKGEGR